MKVINLTDTVDCFGFCGVGNNECSATYNKRCPLRLGGQCNFHKTREQFDMERKQAVDRFNKFSVDKRKKIVLKYGSEFLR